MERLPARRPLDRAAVERVLARAASLQAGTPDSPTGELTEEQLLELGNEVGLSPQHLRQALAEERTRVTLPEQAGTLGQMFGPPLMQTSRSIPGTPDRLLAALDRIMQRDECLQVKRRHPERMTWESRRDLLSSIKRGFDIGGRGYALAKASEVAATVTPIDDARSLVRLEADLSGPRREHVWWSTLSAGGGIAVGAGVVTLATVATGGSVALAAGIATLIAGGGAAGAVSAASAQRKLATRVQLAIEQVLDRLEHGGTDGTPSLIARLGSAARSL